MERKIRRDTLGQPDGSTMYTLGGKSILVVDEPDGQKLYTVPPDLPRDARIHFETGSGKDSGQVGEDDDDDDDDDGSDNDDDSDHDIGTRQTRRKRKHPSIQSLFENSDELFDLVTDWNATKQSGSRRNNAQTGAKSLALAFSSVAK